MGEINVSGVQTGVVEEIPSKQHKNKFLHGKSIAISVSENEDLEKLGFTIQHLNDITIEIARYVIANDGKALYGGDLRHNGFTNLFSELSNQYKKMNDDTSGFVNYFVFPNTKQLTRDARIHFLSKNIEINEVEDPQSLTIDYNIKYDPKTNIVHRHIYSECFKEMRIKMAKDCTARVLVGGKITNYLGYIPGIIEEALLTLKENKPIYLVGGFGGATLHLINSIKGKEVKELTNESQYNSQFLKDFQEFIKDKCEYSDFESLMAEFEKYDLEKLSELNKLSVEENEILFSSKNIQEIVFLLMKGIKAI